VKIGIISDTHGLLRPQVFDVFQGVEHILHAGDIGNLDIISELEAIAPVTAVWGNADGLEVRGRVPEVAEVELGGVRVAVIHGMQVGSPTPEKIAALHPGAGLVVFGHSHRPLIRQVGDTLAVNPGSAGRRRFRDPVTVALAEISDGSVSARLIELDVEKR
jgi:hypothetical protein